MSDDRQDDMKQQGREMRMVQFFRTRQLCKSLTPGAFSFGCRKAGKVVRLDKKSLSAILSASKPLPCPVYGQPIVTLSWLTCRAAVLEALKPLGTLGKGIYGGDAIYIWAKLPEGGPDNRPSV